MQDKYEGCKDEKNRIMEGLTQIIVNSKTALEGNCFYYHGTLKLSPELYTKQVNLFWCGNQATHKLCEIGFNGGHSAMLLLLGRPSTPLEFTVFDIGCHAYTKPCVDYLASQFKHVTFEYIEGDSTVTMPAWMDAHPCAGHYDVVHVDGGHDDHCITNDMKNADWIVKHNGLIIVDDSCIPHIANCIQLYLDSGRYREIWLLSTEVSYGAPHRILQKL